MSTVTYACPRCDQPLVAIETGHRCSGCRVDFPWLAGIPWLFAEPSAALGEWRARWHFALRRLEREAERLAAALRAASGSRLASARIAALHAATLEHRARLAQLLDPLELSRLRSSYETHLALRTRLPADQGLTTYYANVHRDWAWGDVENAASLAIIDAARGDRAPGRTLVLGAGAGRLAYDFHMHTDATITVALDFNPLLVLIAARVSAGERIELHEFPIAPRSVTDQAVLRTLAAPAPARAGLCFVLGDAHRPPFPAGSFDTVITPWLVDILPEPFEDQAARINRLLAPGGTWLNFGSLQFHDPEPLAQHSVEECVEILERSRFAPVVVSEHEIPYMCSPASRHGRRERVVAWRADKAGDGPPPPRHRALPDWLVLGDRPVPVGDAFRHQVLATQMHAFIMSLLDGSRSVKDIAQIMVARGFLSETEAEPTIRGFLIKMYDDSRRAAGY